MKRHIPQEINKMEAIESDLHTIVNWLHLGIVLPLESMEEWLKKENYGKIKEILPGLILQSRNILRKTKKIQSNILKDQNRKIGNFPTALKQLINLWKERTGLQGNITINCPKEFEASEMIKQSLLIMVDEGISNAIKHSGVRDNPNVKIDVIIKNIKNCMVLEIRDNGLGADKIVAGYGVKKIKRSISRLNKAGIVSNLEIITSPDKGFKLKAVVKA
jgi:signal transduction histidine kinase